MNINSYGGFKPLSIIQVVSTISDEAKGPTYSILRLSDELADMGNNVALLALKVPLQAVPERTFITIFPFGLGPKKLGLSPKLRKWLIQKSADNLIQIMHSHSIWMMPGIYAEQSAKKHKIPLLVSPRGAMSKWAMNYGSPAKKLFWPLVQRPALKSVSCFHATSFSEYQDIRRNGFRQPVAIIPNGIDIPSLKSRNISSTRNLLFLGRIHPVKGIDDLLRAWHIVSPKFPSWNLQIVGPDSDEHLKDLKGLVTKLGISRVKFLGLLQGERKIMAYQNAELYVLPSHSENFGVTVAEALASGIPAIVSKGAPWSDLEKNRAGWWIEPGVDSLVQCLNEVLKLSSEELSGMGSNGREWMRQSFSWVKIAKQMQVTYLWLRGCGNKPSWVYED